MATDSPGKTPFGETYVTWRALIGVCLAASTVASGIFGYTLAQVNSRASVREVDQLSSKIDALHGQILVMTERLIAATQRPNMNVVADSSGSMRQEAAVRGSMRQLAAAGGIPPHVAARGAWTTEEFAQFMGLSVREVQDRCRTGEINGRKNKDGHWEIPLEDRRKEVDALKFGSGNGGS